MVKFHPEPVAGRASDAVAFSLHHTCPQRKPVRERKASKELEGADPKHVNPGQTTGFESIKVGEKINPDDDPKEKVKHPKISS
jgi:hypothetical protein